MKGCLIKSSDNFVCTCVTGPWGWTQPLTEMGTRNLPGDVARQDRKASVSLLFRKCEILDISQPYRPPWPVTDLAIFFNSMTTSSNSTINQWAF
jgi:hypothetical protein